MIRHPAILVALPGLGTLLRAQRGEGSGEGFRPMVDLHRATLEHDGKVYEATASLNNCSGLWTAVLRSDDGRIAGNGAGFSSDEAIRVAIELMPRGSSATSVPR